MVTAATFFNIGMIAYALAIKAVDTILKGVSMMDALKQFGVIALMMAATAVVAIAAALLISDGGMTLGLAMAGALLAAVLFNVGIIAYAGGIYAMSKILKGIDMLQTLKQLGVITLMMAATGLMAVGAAALGLAVAGPQGRGHGREDGAAIGVRGGGGGAE